MVKALYQPERGDFIYLDFTPHAGTEQAGRRPALVLSAMDYNVATGHCFVVPLTTVAKPSSFDVLVPKGGQITGYILANQLRDLNWIARNASFHSRCDQATLFEVIGRIEAILALDCNSRPGPSPVPTSLLGWSAPRRS